MHEQNITEVKTAFSLTKMEIESRIIYVLGVKKELVRNLEFMIFRYNGLKKLFSKCNSMIVFIYMNKCIAPRAVSKSSKKIGSIF